MHTQCKNGLCATPNWIRRVLFGAGIYHILFGIWAICLPFQWFDLISIAHPNHPLLWQAVGLIVGILGIAMMMAARNPLDYWMTVSIALIKFTVGIVGFSIAFANGQIPIYTIWLMVVNDLIWWPPFAIVLWTCIKAHSGVPPTRSMPLEIGEAAREYTLSNGKTLEEASRSRLIAIVFRDSARGDGARCRSGPRSHASIR